MDIIFSSTRRIHKERHLHHCPIHARNKCLHTEASTLCQNCMFEEDNDVCQKVVHGTQLQYHDFPCINCNIHFRNAYGGETLVDAFIDLEQAQRLREVAPDAKVEERDERAKHD